MLVSVFKLKNPLYLEIVMGDGSGCQIARKATESKPQGREPIIKQPSEMSEQNKQGWGDGGMATAGARYSIRSRLSPSAHLNLRESPHRVRCAYHQYAHYHEIHVYRCMPRHKLTLRSNVAFNYGTFP